MSGQGSKRADQASDDLRKNILKKSTLEGLSVSMGGPGVASDIFEPKYAYSLGIGQTRDDAEQLWAAAKEVATVSNVVKEIMSEKQVSPSWAHRLARKQSAEEALKTPFPSSLKDQILELLYRHNKQDAANLLGLVRAISPTERSVTMQELTAAIWSCQKQGWVAFRENHGAHGSALTNIKLTPSGRNRAIELRGTPHKAVAERATGPSFREQGHADNISHGATHSVGIDKTNYRHHTSRAQGDEPEKHRPVQFSQREGIVCSWDKEAWPCMVAQKWTRDEQRAQPIQMMEGPGQVRITRIVEAPRRVVDPPHQNENPEYPNPEYPNPEYPVESSPVEETPDAPSTEVVIPTIADVIAWDQYPLMSALHERNKKAAKYRAAAELLQDDDPEAAVELLEKVKFSELEEEVVRLLQELGR
jgi:hypothetical protein